MYRSRWESSNKALLEMAEEVLDLITTVDSRQYSFHTAFSPDICIYFLPFTFHII